MRKLGLLLVICTISLMLMGNSQAYTGGLPLKYYPKNSVLIQTLELDSKRLLGNIIVLPLDPFNEIEAAAIITRINQLPQSLLKKINQEGIDVKLFNGRLTDNPTTEHLRGLVPRGYINQIMWDDIPGIGGSKTVLVKIGHSEKGKGHGSVNLELHELAHSIDRQVFDDLRYNQRYLKIWNDEKGNVFPNQDYFLTFSEEYFAETFAMFYLGGEHKEQLRLKAPKTYDFIKNLY
ncbi:toxin [Bacillus sp. 31A1R]|uniref:Toxin n=1 Tax=Robertmurraya mangrovi TaxID=3098077 RepID=A0ABU5J155_9BACI|nr:toxin [Bacillus sp. 31A1R]MDZ5473138.1 toxin [Bacillus sp. 31A1R]